jgi:phospholipid/cholesterol/gamma-HCH transport system substrate-binding protein
MAVLRRDAKTGRVSHQRGPRNWVIGAIALVLIAIGSYLAYTKDLPFTGKGYEVHATFENAATLRSDSPVRIAGVNVGKVTGVEGTGNMAEVTFTVDDEGQPIHEDATAKIRPRLFLEGNFFVDLQPGSPSAPELPDDGQIPVTQTSTAVQLDEILTALDSDSRVNLQELLEGYGTALTYEPTPADDADQDPDVEGESAAEALNDTFRWAPRANRDTAIVNEAFRGQEPHDLSKLIAAQGRVFGELLSVEDQLKDLITNFNTTAGAFAAESANLSESVRLLAPTLENGEPALRHLSDALPPVRALARESIPGVRELPATIQAGNPWLEQAGALLTEPELGGLARELRKAAPSLAKTTHATLDLFPQITLTSRCVTDVLEPTGNVVIDDAGGTYPFSTGQPNFNELFYGAVSFAGATQAFDGNGAFVRAQSGGGPVRVQATNPLPNIPSDAVNYGTTISAPLGTRPTFTTDVPPFRADVPCHENPVADLNGGAGLPGGVGPPSPQVSP